MKARILLLVFPILSACSGAAPDCADKRTVDAVIRIAKQKITSQNGPDALNGITLNVVNIRTTDTNEKLGSYACAADFDITGRGISKRLPIRYTSELADGGKNFYVTVYGL